MIHKISKLCYLFQTVCNTKVNPTNVLPGLMSIKNNGIEELKMGGKGLLVQKKNKQIINHEISDQNLEEPISV